MLTDTVKRRECYSLYSLWHWEPMKHVANVRTYLPTPTTKRAVAFSSEPSEVDG